MNKTSDTTESDAQLVQAARSGNLESFGCLYERHYSAVVAVCRSFLADYHLAQDAAQDAFAVAAQNLDQLRRTELLAPWLIGIARNTARKIARKQRNCTTSDDLPIFEAPESQLDCMADIESSNAIRRAVWKLPPKSRKVILLRYWADLTYEQIAELLGISPLAVNGRLIRARKKIEKQLIRQELL